VYDAEVENVTDNAVLASLRAQRDHQMDAMDAVLAQVQERDLVDAERNLLEATRGRIEAIDAQIAPLEAYEGMRVEHRAALHELPRPAEAHTPRPIYTNERQPQYRSAGEFLVDYLRANGIMERGHVDEQAAQRIYQMRADQTTADTPGILPTPIVGQVVSLLDTNRPLIASLGGAKSLGSIPGTSFNRPKITVHTQSGAQSAEKTALPSRKMTIAGVPFTKTTRGGYVDISRQDMDWSSPSAWDILVADLANVYAVDVETTVAAAFATAATGTKPPALPAAPALVDWSKGLYTAAMHSYTAGQRMPTRIWCSLDVWAGLGALVDTQRVVFPVDLTREMGAPGTSSLAEFSGDMFGLPRIVAPYLPAKTCIVGPDNLYEVYEEVLGVLSVVEPSILGVQVAYGGYIAFGTLAGAAYVPLDLSAVTSLPTVAEAEDMLAEAQEEEAETGGATGGNGGGGRKR
jgi:HK97 family phage major capsid protein